MKILFYNSRLISEDNIVWGIVELGIDVEKSETVVDCDTVFEDQVEIITREARDFDIVITRNFSVNVAEACHIINIPYISWCYDSMLIALYSKEALYHTNYVFAFDKKSMLRLKKLGIRNVYYQPLAANMITAGRVVITDEDIRKYARDVSFVGGMYYKRFYEIFKREVAQDCLDECESMFARHLCRWERDSSIFDELSDDTINAFYSIMSKENRDLYSISDRYLTECLIMVTELTSRERFRFLNESAERFNTVVHTHEPGKVKDLLKADVQPPVTELSDELYKIYAASKININLTMRSIETGVPQRVFDIMSVGGCVFTNYQEEAEELFEPDKEIVIFRSIEEFTDKARYYIDNEKKRLELGARAYLRVRDNYSYPIAVKNMLSKL